MKSKRPFSSNPFKSNNKKKSLRIRLNSALNDFDKNNRFNTLNNHFRPKTSVFKKGKMNIFSKNEEEKLDVLNLIIETNPNQYNPKKNQKKIFSNKSPVSPWN